MHIVKALALVCVAWGSGEGNQLPLLEIGNIIMHEDLSLSEVVNVSDSHESYHIRHESGRNEQLSSATANALLQTIREQSTVQRLEATVDSLENALQEFGSKDGHSGVLVMEVCDSSKDAARCQQLKMAFQRLSYYSHRLGWPARFIELELNSSKDKISDWTAKVWVEMKLDPN